MLLPCLEDWVRHTRRRWRQREGQFGDRTSAAVRERRTGEERPVAVVVVEVSDSGLTVAHRRPAVSA